MLESLAQTNIGSLNLEEPRMSDIPFIFERDITLQDQEDLINHYNGLEATKPDDQLLDRSKARIASYFKILFPERTKVLHGLEEEWTALSYYMTDPNERYVKEHPDRELDWFDSIEAWMNMESALIITGILFPNRISQINPDGMKFFQDYIKTEGPSLEDSLALKLTFPDLVPSIQELERLFENIKGAPHRINIKVFNQFTFIAATARIIAPQLTNVWKLNKDQWRFLTEKLIQIRQEKNWTVFASLASNMKILAAEEVNITEQGLELIMPQAPTAFNLKTPALPETRKF